MQTLTELLRRLTPRQRFRLAEAWCLPDPAHAEVQSVDELVKALTQYSAIAGMVDRLGPLEASVLRMLVPQPRATLALDTVIRSIAAPPQDTLRAIRSLASHGLVLPGPVAREILLGEAPWKAARTQRGRMLTVPPELAGSLLRIHQAQAAGDTSDRSLESVLETMSVDEIQTVARRWGIDRPHELFRRDLITAIVDRIQDPAAVEQALVPLAADARAVFDAILRTDRYAPAAKVIEQHGPAAVQAAWQQLRPLLLLRDTWREGRRWLFIPAEVCQRDRMRSEVARLVAVPAPMSVRDHRYALSWDLMTLVDYIAREPIRLTSTSRRLPKRLQSSMLQMLRIRSEPGAEDRFEFLLHRAIRMGLIEQDGQTYQAAASIDHVFSRGFNALARDLMESWRDDQTWYEPAGYEGMYWGSSRAEARRRLLRFISDVEPGDWYRLDDLIQHVRAIDPYFMRARHDLLRYRGARALTEAMESWEQVEGRLIRSIIEGPLLWLGVVMLSGSDAEAGTTWALTPLGAWLLDPSRPEPAIGGSQSVVVQPTFEIVVIDPQSLTVHQLNQVADLIQADVAARYALSRDTVLRAVARGWTAGSIIAFLERAAKRDLPQNVRYSIEDWVAKPSIASLRPALLVEFESERAADEWLSSTTVQELGAARIAPQIVALPAGTDERLVTKLLRERGIHLRHAPARVTN